MTTEPLILRCAGRAVDQALNPTGPPCGRTYTGPQHVWDSRDENGWGITRPPTADEVQQRARAAGWRIGPDTATCPTCSRPDPATVQICNQLAQEVAHG